MFYVKIKMILDLKKKKKTYNDIAWTKNIYTNTPKILKNFRHSFC